MIKVKEMPDIAFFLANNIIDYDIGSFIICEHIDVRINKNNGQIAAKHFEIRANFFKSSTSKIFKVGKILLMALISIDHRYALEIYFCTGRIKKPSSHSSAPVSRGSYHRARF